MAHGPKLPQQRVISQMTFPGLAVEEDPQGYTRIEPPTFRKRA